MRDARQGDAGFSALGTPSARASRLTSSLPTPASSSGWTTPCSAAAVRPGRQSPRSSAFAPDRTAAIPRRAASCCELVVELRLAVVAAVATVRPVPLALELGGRDRLVADADRARDVARTVELARRERGRDRRNGKRPAAESACGERGDERRVDPARERDDAAPERADPGLELIGRRHSCWARARASAQTDFTERPVDLASAAQSSCSGATLTTRPSRRPTLTRTVPPCNSTMRSSRSSS